MSVLILDFESTGIDTATAQVIEIGAMVVRDDFSKILEGFNQLVYDASYPELSAEVQKVTGIDPKELMSKGVAPKDAFAQLGAIVSDALNDVKFIVAYNRGYDENLFRAEMARHGFDHPGLKAMLNLPWVCAMVDVESNYGFKCWKLSHLALDNGVAVDPSGLHRAINDVELTRKLLKQIGTNIHEMYAYQQSPWVYVAALCRPPWEDGGKSTAIAKDRGFNFQVCKGDESKRMFEKRWVKRIKRKDFEREERDCLVPIRMIEG